MSIKFRYFLIIFSIVIVLITIPVSAMKYEDKGVNIDTIFYSYSPEKSTIYIESPGIIHFSVDRKKTVPDNKKIKWLLNGKPIAEDVDHLDVKFGDLAKYSLECILLDKAMSSFKDSVNYFSPEASVKWTIRNSSGDKTSPIDINLYGRDLIFKDKNDGAIVVNVQGGKKPYYYYWYDGSSEKNRTNLVPGKYRIRVTDSDFRTLTLTILIKRNMHLDPQVISSEIINGWRLKISGIENLEGISYKWSNNSIAKSIDVIEKGNYSCTVSFNSGNRIKLKISL